jgi:hypothetical protein
VSPNHSYYNFACGSCQNSEDTMITKWLDTNSNATKW